MHHRLIGPRRALAALLTALLAALCLTAPPAAYGKEPERPATAADQVLTWTADNDINRYKTAPVTAVAGPATIVFENSEATGNTTGMPHTLTFDNSNPSEYNADVDLNILANPSDDNGGRHTAEVNLTPGTYRYYCAMPGHGAMQGTLVVTDGGGGEEDTTAPEVSAEVTGQQNSDGHYVGGATVALSATDPGSGVDTVEYALDGGAYTPYSTPVTVDEVGDHTLSYRATDKAGNTSAVRSVDFTVAEPATQDTTAPETSAEVSGERNADGAYVGSATVKVTATDTESGVRRIQYSLNGGPYLDYTAPVVVDRAGDHIVRYRATDGAGNTAAAKAADFTVVGEGGTEPDCPESDNRLTVIVGTVDTGVPNRVTGDGCTINELIEDERAWDGRQDFVKHVQAVADDLRTEGVIDRREHRLITDAARESGIGTPGKDTGYRTLFDGSQQSFEHWEHVGGGAFGLNGDGSMTSSRSVSGMGMLWYPERQFGDFSLKLQFRDDAPDTGRANSGVFTRFPDVHWHPGESRPEWVAIKYGHENQILDRSDGDMYKTGSIYGFDKVGIDGAGVTEKGAWNDYEIRVVDQRYWIYRNGVLLNVFDNDPGLEFTPARSDDPGTSGRQYADGFIGLQVHGTTDVISFRNIRIQEL
ncbi:MAG TPA: hypothetical protein DEQ61_25035 [Streptomyces sp.]|nr:hypothetical protein [Streptomyces sp.]